MTTAGWVPGLADLRAYQRAWLPSDLLAGLSVAAIQVPTAIAYATLAGFRPEVGLYASVLPLVAYACFGSSRQLIVGPDSATCAMVAATLLPLAGHDPHRYADYSVVLALLVGMCSIAGGVARLGFIADFLSRPILTGFLNGIGLSIIVGQFGKLFGIPLASGQFFAQLWELGSRIDETHASTLALGASLLVLLMVLKRFAPKVPGPLAGVIVGGVAAFALDLNARGVAIVGEVPSGLPAFGIPSIAPGHLDPLLAGALGITLVSYCSAMLTARSFAARNHYEIDANQDFIALGIANLAAGLSQGFVISGADSRTAVNNAVGGKSRLAGLVAAAATASVVLFLTGPMRFIPAPALAAVLIVAGAGLIDTATLARLRPISRFEYRLSVTTTLGVPDRRSAAGHPGGRGAGARQTPRIGVAAHRRDPRHPARRGWLSRHRRARQCRHCARAPDLPLRRRAAVLQRGLPQAADSQCGRLCCREAVVVSLQRRGGEHAGLHRRGSDGGDPGRARRAGDYFRDRPLTRTLRRDAAPHGSGRSHRSGPRVSVGSERGACLHRAVHVSCGPRAVLAV